MLFSVMRLDQEISELAQVSLEEVFEADPRARAEYEAQCDIWRNEAIAAQDKEEVCWCKSFESCSMCFGKGVSK